MRILNVNSCFGAKLGGGAAERTFQMGRFLSGLDGVKCTVLTLDIGLEPKRIQDQAPAIVVALPCFFRRFYLPLVNADIWRLICRLVNEADIIHLMSHWSVLNFLVFVAARRARKPYVVCPAGSLPLFGRSGWLKRIYNLLAGSSIIKNASAWIAVTKSEVPHFEKYGIPSRKITVIPNGVSQTDFPNSDKSVFLKLHNLPDVQIILFMGRLNPIKGPDLLLQAFIQARKKLTGYHLVFAGPDGGMLSELRQITEKAGISDYVHFIGYLGAAEKSAAYHHAKLLVVPSRQEAMSIVALEAGICGIPVMVTDQCGFSEIRGVDPSLEVTATSSGIASGLVRLLTETGLLDKIGPAMKAFVSRHYAWDSIVIHYMNLYRRILQPADGNHRKGCLLQTISNQQ